MGCQLRKYFGSDGFIVSCVKCRTHLAEERELISKLFQGQSGPANLYAKVVNVVIDDTELDRYMTTGRHLIRNIRCVGCGVHLGWTYIRAFEEDQRYKEGKFILERACLREMDNALVNVPVELMRTRSSITKLNFYRPAK